MRRIIGTAAATLAVAAAIAASATPAGADQSYHSSGVNVTLGDGSVRFISSSAGSSAWGMLILPYIEQDSVYRQTGGVNIAPGDGSVRFMSNSTPSMQTYRALGTRAGGEVVSSDC